jgi:hypothetical protein
MMWCRHARNHRCKTTVGKTEFVFIGEDNHGDDAVRGKIYLLLG